MKLKFRLMWWAVRSIRSFYASCRHLRIPAIQIPVNAPGDDIQDEDQLLVSWESVLADGECRVLEYKKRLRWLRSAMRVVKQKIASGEVFPLCIKKESV